jgi:hypothetical protein
MKGLFGHDHTLNAAASQDSIRIRQVGFCNLESLLNQNDYRLISDRFHFGYSEG